VGRQLPGQGGASARSRPRRPSPAPQGPTPRRGGASGRPRAALDEVARRQSPALPAGAPEPLRTKSPARPLQGRPRVAPPRRREPLGEEPDQNCRSRRRRCAASPSRFRGIDVDRPPPRPPRRRRLPRGLGHRDQAEMALQDDAARVSRAAPADRGDAVGPAQRAGRDCPGGAPSPRVRGDTVSRPWAAGRAISPPGGEGVQTVGVEHQGEVGLLHQAADGLRGLRLLARPAPRPGALAWAKASRRVDRGPPPAAGGAGREGQESSTRPSPGRPSPGAARAPRRHQAGSVRAPRRRAARIRPPPPSPASRRRAGRARNPPCARRRRAREGALRAPRGRAGGAHPAPPRRGRAGCRGRPPASSPTAPARAGRHGRSGGGEGDRQVGSTCGPKISPAAVGPLGMSTATRGTRQARSGRRPGWPRRRRAAGRGRCRRGRRRSVVSQRRLDGVDEVVGRPHPPRSAAPVAAPSCGRWRAGPWRRRSGSSRRRRGRRRRRSRGPPGGGHGEAVAPVVPGTAEDRH